MFGIMHKTVWGRRAVPILGTVLLAVSLCFSTPAFAREITIIDELFARFIEPQAGAEIPDDMVAQNVFIEEPFFQDLVLAVYVDKQRLSPGIFAVENNARYYLPITTLSDILEFSIQMDKERRYVEGWAVSESRNFSIDALGGKISYKGKTVDLPQGSVLDESIADDDMYVSLDILNQIWPLEFQVNIGSLILKVYPDSRLPFQMALDREKRQKKLLDSKERRSYQDGVEYPFVANPYKLIGKPALDIDVQAGYDGQQDVSDYRFNMTGTQDLAYASADYSAAFGYKGGELDKPENIRFRLRRQAIHEGALPFGLQDTQAGDVRLDNRKLISTGLSGRGAIFSTEPDHRSNEFDVITVEGVGVAGWDVELYVNDELIEFSTVDERGEYRFEDVSIGYGNNRVRVVLYGPQGQIKERTENYFYQASMVKAGEYEFSGGAVDSQRDLIPVEERKTGRPEGFAGNIYGAYGISKKLTAFASLNTLRDDDGPDEVTRKYATAGLAGSLGSTLAQAEFYKELSGGSAVDVRTLSDFKGFKINTKTALYRDFESPDAGNGLNRKKFETETTIRKIFSTFLGTLGLEVGTDYLKRENDTSRTRYTTRQSLGLGGARFTHQTRTNISNGDHSSTSGRLSSTVRKKDWRFRGSLNYNAFPSFEKTSIQGEARYGKPREFSTAFSLQQNFSNDETIAGIQITKDFEKFLGSVDAGWSSEHGASLMLRASTSIAPYGLDGDYIMRSEPLRQSGPVVSHVFVDKDYDGVFSEGDEPVPDTKMTMGRRITKEETDPEGYLLELNPAAGGRTNVAVANNSIDDPYLVSAVDGYSIYPRPGAMHRLEFPLIETGAIDGTLRQSIGGDPIIGLVLELMKDDGQIVQTTKTAPDGYFTFERIPPGSYTIRAAPETGMTIPHKYVNLTVDNLFQFGVDINVQDLNTPVEADLDIGIGQDGLLNATNILSVAKGYKDKGGKNREGGVAHASAIPASHTPSQPSLMHGGAVVNSVRIGQHPDKIRMVMDLSAPVDYTLTHDPASNSIFVEMPMGSWSARKVWERTSQNYFLHNYRVEQLPGTGVRLILGVEDGVKVKASGLLKAHAGKKDRLYIDVERQ
ncbi:MAG: carboxypeptidase regulatory-like domain-containing protein [Alphaproteobacteria bacterium]|nr:carboxypeptidase regulatory-like domain-containing protein [Alphaproteobacteria bacterium]